MLPLPIVVESEVPVWPELMPLWLLEPMLPLPVWLPELMLPLPLVVPEPVVSVLVPVWPVVELPVVVEVGEVGSPGVPDDVGLVVVEGVCCPVVDCDPADDVELWP